MDAVQETRVRRVERVPPATYFVGSAVFHYLGPAFAVLLFALVPPLGVAWLRIAAAAAVFAAWRRPWRTLAALDSSGLRLVVGMGAVLAVMNACFYVAIDRLPLGTVAAIEFLPVILLAAVGTRTPRNLVALVLAVGGVYLLANVRLEAEPVGLAFAFANAALFALYIVLAHRVARHGAMAGIDGLAAAMLVALVVATPLGGWAAVPALIDPVALLAGIGVGITSSVIPYVCDQLAMARMPRATYALLVSLLPATATVIGVVVLRQIPSPAEVAGVALVVAGVGIHREPSGDRSVVPRRRARDSADGAGADGRHACGMRETGGRTTLGTRLFLLAVVVSLCITGAIAIGTLLFAEFDDTAGRILATTGLLSLASLLSLPAGVLLDRGRLAPLAWATIAAAALAFVLAMITIWGQQDQETLSRLTTALWLGAGAGAQAATMTALQRPGDSRRLRTLYAVSIVLTSSLAALIGLALWIEPESWPLPYGRIMGAVAVGAVLTTLLQPILRRMEAPTEKRYELELMLDEPPSEEAVAAAVEALEKHGSHVTKIV